MIIGLYTGIASASAIKCAIEHNYKKNNKYNTMQKEKYSYIEILEMGDPVAIERMKQATGVVFRELNESIVQTPIFNINGEVA